ncbi:hypothetical protein ACL02P_15285 [Paenibacillus sp. MB22_1]|uniref:hypothetical protein n=1 Tax=Paenibacillus sp. MB22_1 TaxID=3383121 RepID=UPI0039A1676A
MATNYDLGIRSALNSKGIDNSRIGYSNGYVTVDGKNFIKADANKNGTTYTSQQNFNNAWNSNFGQPTNQSNAMVQAANSVKSTPQATYTPPSSQTADTLSRINDFINKQSQFQFTAPTPFSYDPQSDAAYQAQLAEAKRNIANQQADTNAFLRANGQGKSSYSEMVANQVADSALGSIANNLVPALMQQAYQRYNDEANRNLQVQQLNYGIGQDAIGNLSSLYGLQDNEYFQKPITEAQLTGNYLPTEARQLINEILGLKQQAEAPGITAQARAGLSQQADVLRGRLQALGIDPSLYGSDVSYSNASRANAGIRTLAGQQLDLQRQGQAFDQKFAQEQFAYQKARDAISDQQWRMQFDEAVRQNGLSYGLQMLQERNQQAYREAQLALAQDDNDRQWYALEQQLASSGAPEYNGMTATQVLDAARQRFAVQTNDGRTVIPQDPTTKEKIYQYVGSIGLPLGQDDQVMLSLGLTAQDIKEFDKKYGVTASGK